MEPDDELVSCAYEAHRNRPESWHGNSADDWQLDTDSWTCNHTVRSELIDSEDDDQFCVFHTHPGDIPEEINEAREFVHAINEQSSSGDEADAKGKKEFVGATFGAFEIERGTIIDADDEHPIRLSHALFQDGLSADHVTFSHQIIARSTEFSGNGSVSFEGVEFSNGGDVSFSSAEFSNEGDVSFSSAEFSNEGDVSFSDAEFRNGGRVWFLSAEFRNEGRVSFQSVEFNNSGDVSFTSANFSSDDRVSFQHVKFINISNVSFSNAEFNGVGNVSFTSAEFSSDDRVSFINTEFSGVSFLDFMNVKFSRDGDVSFNGAEFSCDRSVSFRDAEFRGEGNVSFSNTEFSGGGNVSFSNTEFRGKVSFDSAEFTSTVHIKIESFDCPRSVSFANVDFTNSNLHIDSMAEMNLKRANFSGVNLSGIDFSNARLELAVFSRSVLYNSNFVGAELDGASFGNAQVNELTKFVGIVPKSEEHETIFYDPEYLQETDAPLTMLRSAISQYFPRRPVWSHDPRISPPAKSESKHINGNQYTEKKKVPDGGEKIKDEVATDSENAYGTSDGEENWELEYLQKAARTYHTIEKIGRENSLPDLQTIGFIRRQEMHRYRYAEQAATSSNGSIGYWVKWLRASVARLTLLYGESPWRVIAVALSVILTSALLYPLGGFRYAGGDVVQAESFAEYLSILPDSLYFSTLTFTTLGFGDFQPYTWGRWLATMETALGATLIALLVFVLGRRAAR